jgi:hypothetical protein
MHTQQLSDVKYFYKKFRKILILQLKTYFGQIHGYKLIFQVWILWFHLMRFFCIKIAANL